MYYLSTCSTCKRIMDEMPETAKVELQDIKTEAITAQQLEDMKARAGSYEALFSKRAMKYRSLGLHEKELSEEDMRDWILKEYTFLKRPVTIINDDIYIGSAKKTVNQFISALRS